MPYLLQQLLTDSAVLVPNREAVRFEGRGLTYARLECLSNQVARALQTAGVQRGDRVGIYLHKSFASIIGVFGVLKSGGVYVPLDPNAPPKRLAYICRNAEVRVMLTSAEKLETIPDLIADGVGLETLILLDHYKPDTIVLNELIDVVAWEHVCSLDPGPFPSVGTIETDLAYILYTSGSTGESKGVMISHRTIFTFINWCDSTFGLTENDRVTSHAPLHFDLSTFDIYVTIKSRGTVVLVPEVLSIFPLRLVELLQAERITVTYLVPSVLALIVNHGKPEDHDLSALRLILFAGEIFPIKYLRQLATVIPGAAYYNLYGPTETNVCTYYRIEAKDLAPERGQPVPIGIACENVEVFAVDEAGELVTEPGREGELWVRGSCVAQGYWRDPQKTSQVFVRNPFRLDFEEVVYRTGDIVSLDSDGLNWHYVGRSDQMVKSRGYRIELGEIESVLYTSNWVKEAVVTTIPDELIGNRLIAWVVPLDGSSIATSDLLAHCSQYLPRYMIPEFFEILDALPKTSTGKVDRLLLTRQMISGSRGGYA